MKIIEGKKQYNLDLPPIGADKIFTVYDKNTKTYRPAEHIKNTCFWSSHFALAICGSAGSGKTSTLCSLVCSMKPESRVYAQCFDKIILNIPPASLRTLKNKPFDELPNEQIFPEFNEEFIDNFTETMKENADAEEPKDHLLIIDDAVTRLRGNKRVSDKFIDLLNTRRHLKFSVILLCQDIIQLTLPMRNSLNGLIVFRQPNMKRLDLINEEYLSLSTQDYKNLIDYVWRKKGDSLMVRMDSGILSFYRNFTPLEFYCSCPQGKKRCNLRVENKNSEESKDESNKTN